MERIDLAEPGLSAPTCPQADSRRGHPAARRRSTACSARLEDERTRTAAAVLHAQESERARVARDLHDECNQALTAVLLRLEARRPRRAAEELRAELRETKAVAVARRWTSCCASRASCAPPRSTTTASRPRCATSVERLQPPDGRPGDAARAMPDVERPRRPTSRLVVYRVVQESLSNITRHADAPARSVELGREPRRTGRARRRRRRAASPAPAATTASASSGCASARGCAGGRLDVRSDARATGRPSSCGCATLGRVSSA